MARQWTQHKKFLYQTVKIKSYAIAAVWLIAALAIEGCASLGSNNCPPGSNSAVQDALYFGTAKPNGTVSSQEWSDFLNNVITARYPQGLTSWPAAGQWRMANGEITREVAYVVHILHPDTDRNEQEVRDIVNAYKMQFQQEAVLRVRSPVCFSF